MSKTGCRGNPDGVTEGERVAEPETDGVPDPDGVVVEVCECVGGLRDCDGVNVSEGDEDAVTLIEAEVDGVSV